MKKAVKGDEGYTLLELLVVLVILVLIVGIAGPQVLNQLSTSKVKTAQIEVNRLVTELEFYRVDVGNFPADTDGLASLVPNYLAKSSMTIDPWGNAYNYNIVGNLPVVTSNGPDGVSGGSDDISSAN